MGESRQGADGAFDLSGCEASSGLHLSSRLDHDEVLILRDYTQAGGRETQFMFCL